MQKPEVYITRSWRKSISMSFDKNGVLQVKAPKLLLKSQIQSFLEKNTVWIHKHYAKILERKKDTKLYLFGEPLWVTHPWIPSLKTKGRRKQDILPLVLREGVEHGETEGLITFYKSQAKKYIIPRCNELAEKYGFSHRWIRITSASTRWGSCSSKKTLNFSYRLVMAPKKCIDYVIIHELCHLRQMNHSSKFWSEVAAIMPEYKKYETHLKEFGWRYTL